MPDSNRRGYLDQCHGILPQSRKLSIETGGSIWLKLGALQSTGSFKVRGLGAAYEEYLLKGYEY